MAAEQEQIRRRQQEMVAAAVAQWGPKLQGRVAVVTGGARGIGRAMVEGLLAAGARVAVLDKTWDGAQEFAERLAQSGAGLALTTDISEDAQLDEAKAAVLDRWGTVDVLINNAGIVSETLFYPAGHVKTLDTKDSDWETMFRVNVFGTVKVIRRFIEPMRAQHRGSIITVISSGVLPAHQGGAYFGWRPWTVEMPYQATKAAEMALSFFLAEEVRTEGVAVNTIMPGHTRTSWFDTTARAWQQQQTVYFLRPVIPEHVTPLTLFLATQDGSGATGRLYYVPEWNYDHGFGDYPAWHDHALPEDLEKMYSQLEQVMPKYERAGVSHLPFDAWAAVWVAGMERLAGTGSGTKD
jgi:NAD(P)-dependent dehydrogenase (short-subunit alcohol dehydrogenase family)